MGQQGSREGWYPKTHWLGDSCPSWNVIWPMEPSLFLSSLGAKVRWGGHVPDLSLQYGLKGPRPQAHLPGIWQWAGVQRGYSTPSGLKGHMATKGSSKGWQCTRTVSGVPGAAGGESGPLELLFLTHLQVAETSITQLGGLA